MKHTCSPALPCRRIENGSLTLRGAKRNQVRVDADPELIIEQRQRRPRGLHSFLLNEVG